MRNLCAEAIYNINVGPAIDCHCIRYGVEFGIVHASMSQEHMSQIMCQDFPPALYPSLNEVPATISQLLSSTETPVEDKISMVKELFHIACSFSLEICLMSFLTHYPPVKI